MLNIAKIKLFTERLLKSFIALGILGLIAFAASVILLQDYLILPSLIQGKKEHTPPGGVEQITLSATDGTKINVWHIPQKIISSKKAVLLTHGNGDTVQNSLGIQYDFNSAGYSTYGFDYRGTGGSEGWPNEERLYADADQVWKYIEERENITSAAITPVGYSFGTGLATYLAETHSAKSLVLIAPYSSIPDVVSESGIYALFRPFVRYQLPSIKRIAKMPNTCVIAAHGKLDRVIASHHTEDMAKAYQGTAGFFPIISDNSNHWNIFQNSEIEIFTKLTACLSNQMNAYN